MSAYEEWRHAVQAVADQVQRGMIARGWREISPPWDGHTYVADFEKATATDVSAGFSLSLNAVPVMGSMPDPELRLDTTVEVTYLPAKQLEADLELGSDVSVRREDNFGGGIQAGQDGTLARTILAALDDVGLSFISQNATPERIVASLRDEPTESEYDPNGRFVLPLVLAASGKEGEALAELERLKVVPWEEPGDREDFGKFAATLRGWLTARA